MKRKLIGFITAFPESIYAQRLMDGVFSRCDSYGYDVAVFAPMTQVCSYQKDYLAGELNIYSLINFDLLDGVIVDGASVTEDNVQSVKECLLKLLAEKCTKPVVSLGLEFGDYPALFTIDKHIFREITSHVIDIHGCKDIYFLAGTRDHTTSIDRLTGFIAEMNSRGLEVPDDKIFYGDFWYSGGAALADKIISGKVRKPEAIICASDHMAIGLVNRLTEDGIRVPEDIIVTGFDASQEAAINNVTVTSFVPECAKTAADAVDAIRRIIEPEAEIIPRRSNMVEHLRTGMSCGCSYDHKHIMNLFRDSLYYTSRDYNASDLFDKMDIGMLMESYMFEYLSGTDDPQDCIHEIYNFTYLLRPYADFYLCLDEKWLSTEKGLEKGYPRRMRQVIHSTPAAGSGHFERGPIFHTSRMLPELSDDHDRPSVYYFSPIHFQNETLGYSVIRCELTQKHKINSVTRNWLRNVNNALEMIRSRNRLISLSRRDGMTGVYNRRGMELLLDDMLTKAADTDSVLAFVIDMDRLKYINDTFGHEEGDYGINTVCDAARSITEDGEICVRAGGDEFYVIGIGDYTDEDIHNRISRFREALEEANQAGGKPYKVSASIGSACIPISSGMQVTGVIRIADAKMYESKVRKKQHRI